MANLSFKNDIAPIFAPFYANMLWRFDLRNYDHVVANATLIQQVISLDPSNGNPMPPPQYPPLRQEDVDTFNAWVAQGCPE